MGCRLTVEHPQEPVDSDVVVRTIENRDRGRDQDRVVLEAIEAATSA